MKRTKMSNHASTIALALATFAMVGCGLSRKASTIGDNGVPHMTPPDAKEIKAVMAAHGTNSWDFQMQKNGSMVSQMEVLSKHNGIQFVSLPDNQIIAERVDPEAMKNAEAQVTGQTSVDPKEIGAANWQILVNDQQKALTAWQNMPPPPLVGRPVGPH
jgi:hypothetical protein